MPVTLGLVSVECACDTGSSVYIDCASASGVWCAGRVTVTWWWRRVDREWTSSHRARVGTMMLMTASPHGGPPFWVSGGKLHQQNYALKLGWPPLPESSDSWLSANQKLVFIMVQLISKQSGIKRWCKSILVGTCQSTKIGLNGLLLY